MSLALRVSGQPKDCFSAPILLVALGAAGVVWVFYLAETTGDMEAWAIPVNLLLVAQGAVTALYLWRNASQRAS